MLKIGILGLGQAGSNIADYAVTRGFTSVAVNTASIDLNALKYIPTENRIFLEGFNGAGRDRTIGKSAMVSNAEKLFNISKEKLGECDIILIAGGGAGGTGSGAFPVAVDVLLELFPIVNIIYALPDNLESPASKINAYDCFSELSENPQIGSIFIVDNDKGRQILSEPKYKVHDILNQNIIDLIADVNQYTDKISYTNNFDERDFMDILFTRGCSLITYSKVNITKDLIDNDISSAIQKSWDTSFTPNYNKNNIVKCAILGNLHKSDSGKFNLSQIFNENIPYDIRDSLYDISPEKSYYEFYSIYSGLKFPDERLNQIKSDIEKVQDNLVERIEMSQNQKVENISWKINSSRFDRQVKDSQVSLSEKLKKFK